MANEKRLIDARALKDAMYSIATVTNNESIFIDVIIDEIDNAQPVDAGEVVHGRWFDYDNDPMWQECSACGYRIQYSYSKDCNYCPNCGAKMDGDGNG